MKKLILHIPHSSTCFPDKEGFVLKDERIESEVNALTDWFTDDLYNSDQDEMIVADFSRIYCDAERFPDDEKEAMTKFGMGVLYEKTISGVRMRNVNADLKERILKEHYWPHHQRLSSAVAKQLKDYDKALVFDCHSFPNHPYIEELYDTDDLPDFSLGTDPFHTPQHLIDQSIEFFESKGFSLGVDWPFKGALVPMDYYQKDQKLSVIMLEINRKLYLKDGGHEKSDNYQKVKQTVCEYIDLLKQNIKTEE